MKACQGYRGEAYARTLSEFGEPIRLQQSGGWVLRRQIPDSDRFDAMGCYPIFSCEHWAGLGDDLRCLAMDGLVSLVMVSDPFSGPGEAVRSDFFDLARPFKTHFVADLDLGPDGVASAHHRYEARRGLRRLVVDAQWKPSMHLKEWLSLYEGLVSYRGISGLRAFSEACFENLFAIDDVLLVRAIDQGVTVGAQVLLAQDDVIHAHLAAFTPDGYKHGASYALDWFAMDFLKGEFKWIDWGGQAGLEAGGHDGLAKYKQGWASETRATWLLGAILDRRGYEDLVGCSDPGVEYFPRYRSGEFA
jgi:hypothetical protein